MTYLKIIYDRIISLLVTPVFYMLAKVFSHGATHFLFFFLIAVLTSFFWYQNNKVEIAPHQIAIGIEWTNELSAVTRNKYVTLKDSISNLEIHLELNSKNAEEETNGLYHNRLVLQFDGDGKEEVIPLDQIHPTINFVTKAITQGEEDSVRIVLFSDPILQNMLVDVKSNSWVESDSIPDIRAEVPDSNNYYISEIWGPGIFIESSDTTEYFHHYDDKDSVHVVKLIPNKYDVEGKKRSPRQSVSFYSDGLGVEKGNPYYYYFISIPTARIAGNLKLDFKVSDVNTHESSGFKYSTDKYLQYDYIFPTPDVVNNGYIVYNTKSKMAEIQQNHGVIIQATDVGELNKTNSKSFLYSVLIGTAIAFLLDIIIQMIKELRNLNLRYRKDNNQHY